MNKKLFEVSEKNKKTLPIIAKFWELSDIKTRRFVNVEKYQTNKYLPYGCYKSMLNYYTTDE